MLIPSFVLFFSLLVTSGHGASQPNCVKKYFNQNSFVCACSLFSCPPIEPARLTPKGYLSQWTSSRSQHRFHHTVTPIKDTSLLPITLNSSSSVIRVNLHRNERRQTIEGFGAALTDSAGLNLFSLPFYLRDRIMIDYFSPSGISYSMVRVPIGGTDFSTRIYTLDDQKQDDFNLAHFSLQPEDYHLKIPMIRRAMELQSHLKLLGSAWSSPAWMKTNHNISGSGLLKGSPGGRYYKTWAKYYVKFLDAYAAQGIRFWGLTAGNEPTNDIVHKNFFFNSLGFTPQIARDFLKLDLGPTLRDAGYGTDKLEMLIYDDKRQFLPNYTDVILSDPVAASFATGVAFHWYTEGEEKYYEALTHAHERFPRHFLLGTEAAEGFERFSTRRAELGNWTRAETYARDIIQDLNRYTTGWLDWNLVLDTKGGPSWAENWTDGLILIDRRIATYYRNPMFYALGHFSKFLPPGSVCMRFDAHGNAKGVSLTAFTDPYNQTVVVALNTNDGPVNLIFNHLAETPVSITMDGHSIKTLITPSPRSHH